MSTSASRWISRVLYSCKTPEQVDSCRKWIDHLSFRREIGPGTADTLMTAADAVEAMITVFTLWPISETGGAHEAGKTSATF